MFTVLATTGILLNEMTKVQPVAKVEAKPEYLQRVDEHVEALFTPERIAEYKRLGLM